MVTASINIVFGVLSLAVLSECYLQRGDSVPVATTSNMPKKYDWAILNDIVMNMLKPTTPHPTTSTLPSANEETSSPRSETPEELIAQVFQEVDSQPELSPGLDSNHKTSTPVYLSSTSRTTTSSPILAPQRIKSHETQPTNNDGRLFLLPTPVYPQSGSYYQPSSKQFQYSQPLAPQPYEFQPPFHYVPQEIPVSYNTLPFYNNPDLTSPLMQTRSETPYYQPSYMPEEVPVHSLRPIPYQSPLTPTLTQEQLLSQLSQVQTSPSLNHGSVPLHGYGAPLNGDTGVNYDPSSFLPFLNNLPQTHVTPGPIVSSFVRSYIPQQQFHPSQLHALQPPIFSLQPPVYGPVSPQLTQEDIISLIQRSHQSSFPGVISPALSPSSFSLQNFGNRPNFGPDTTSTGKVSTPYSSVPFKSRAPLPYYREPRASGTTDALHHPVPMFADMQLPMYDNLRDLHYV